MVKHFSLGLQLCSGHSSCLNLVTDSTRNRNAITSYPKAKDIFHTVLQHSSLFLDSVCRSYHGLNANRHNTQKLAGLGCDGMLQKKTSEDKEVRILVAQTKSMRVKDNYCASVTI